MDLSALRDQLAQKLSAPGSAEAAYKITADFAQQHGLSADHLNQMVQSYGGPVAAQFDTGRIQNILDQYGAPQYGLQGATSAIRQGTTDANNSIQQGLGLSQTALLNAQTSALAGLGNTQTQVSGLFNQGQQALQPFTPAGLKANDLQAALSGALGPEAQKQAFAQYQESPGVDYARQQSERAITRNGAALGGAMNGNVMSELSRNAVGMYLQDFGNQFNRIGSVADRGLSAAGAQAGLRGQEAGLQGQLGQFGAQIPLQTGQQIADLNTSAYNTIGGMQYGTGNNLGAVRYQAGQDLANSVSSTTSALSSLINQQGIGLTDITGNTVTSLNELYKAASAGDANAMEQLAALLGNISTGSASQVSGLPIIPGSTSNYLGNVATIAGGVGGLASGLNYMRQPATQPVYSQINPRAYDVVNPGNYGGYA